MTSARCIPDEADDRAASFKARTRRSTLRCSSCPATTTSASPAPHPWAGFSVTSERLNAHREVFGADRFLHIDRRRGRCIGLNSELIGSGLPEEADQWGWLEDAVAESGQIAR